MSLEENIRQIVIDELSKRQPAELISIEDFCKRQNICRTTVWKAEKRGDLKCVRIGKRVFINTQQLSAA